MLDLLFRTHWLPLAILLSSLLPGLVIFFLKEESSRWRISLNMLGATVKMLLIAIMILGLDRGYTYRTTMAFLPGIELVLHADPLSVLFAALSAALWFWTTLYAVGYLEESPNRSRFFGFFSLCVSATAGIALAGNLITFLIFYELLTLTTYPLVVHRGTPAAIEAGRIYLAYTIAGGLVLTVGTIWLWSLAGHLDFAGTGRLTSMAESDHWRLTAIFFLLLAGLGVKAALVPLHFWLPVAMIAPAPVSALLHAVAVVKAGAFGIVRVVFDLYGLDLAARLQLLQPLGIIASITIIYGSLQALQQDDLKRRLAYSTVSQVSYIILGMALGGYFGVIGGMVHLIHQGLMKITLFFCAGNLAETLGIHRISEMDGVGRRMPWTMTAFTVAALGMIGIPPMAGFISKWYLGLGALEAHQWWVILVLVGSGLLNAAYFLPVLHIAWFKEPPGRWPHERRFGRRETHLLLLLPPMATALLVIAAGLLAGSFWSPLGWVDFIVAGGGVK
jgi:formate hydrogenlyase subunit 3/multisubunit Na+/H+ antiporter MnhD subunit